MSQEQNEVYKGVLIEQSVSNPELILQCTKVLNTRSTTLEGESFRGSVLFHNIEVTQKNIWTVLSKVAELIKSPGWYFHLVNERRLYIVMSNVILIASNDEKEIQNIIDYAVGHGIHPDQLNLKKLLHNPYA